MLILPRFQHLPTLAQQLRKCVPERSNRLRLDQHFLLPVPPAISILRRANPYIEGQSVLVSQEDLYEATNALAPFDRTLWPTFVVLRDLKPILLCKFRQSVVQPENRSLDAIPFPGRFPVATVCHAVCSLERSEIRSAFRDDTATVRHWEVASMAGPGGTPKSATGRSVRRRAAAVGCSAPRTGTVRYFTPTSRRSD